MRAIKPDEKRLRDGLVPRMMAFEGANFDIIFGASAPMVAWLLATRGVTSRPSALRRI